MVFRYSTDQIETLSLSALFRASVWSILDRSVTVRTNTGSDLRTTIALSARPVAVGRLPGKSLKDVLAEAKAKDKTGALAEARKELAKVQLSTGAKLGLRQIRLGAGLSQAEFAARLRTSQSYVARLEQGAIANPKLERLAQMADILNVSLENLSQALGRRA